MATAKAKNAVQSATPVVVVPATKKRTPNTNSFAYRCGQRAANGVMHTSNATTWCIDSVAQAAVDLPAGYAAQSAMNHIAPVVPRARS